MSQTLITLMTAAGLGLLAVVMLVQVLLAGLLWNSARQLQEGKSVRDALANTSANLSALRKEHLALDELVSQWMQRSATRAKRAKKEKEEQQEETEPDEFNPRDVFFPTIESRK